MGHQPGPTLLFSDRLHAEKYRLPNETFREACNRVAAALKDDEDHFHAFREPLLAMRFMPAGRIQAAMGAPKAVTPYNCLAGDTEILTNLGMQSIQKLAGTSTYLLDGAGRWVNCAIYDHGYQDTIEITFRKDTKRISLRATPEHKWLTPSGQFIKTEELEIGTLIGNIQPQPLIFDTSSEIYKKGIWHGLIYGDGTAQDGGYTIAICSPFLNKAEYSYHLVFISV